LLSALGDTSAHEPSHGMGSNDEDLPTLRAEDHPKTIIERVSGAGRARPGGDL